MIKCRDHQIDEIVAIIKKDGGKSKTNPTGK